MNREARVQVAATRLPGRHQQQEIELLDGNEFTAITQIVHHLRTLMPFVDTISDRGALQSFLEEMLRLPRLPGLTQYELDVSGPTTNGFWAYGFTLDPSVLTFWAGGHTHNDHGGDNYSLAECMSEPEGHQGDPWYVADNLVREFTAGYWRQFVRARKATLRGNS